VLLCVCAHWSLHKDSPPPPESEVLEHSNRHFSVNGVSQFFLGHFIIFKIDTTIAIAILLRKTLLSLFN